MSNLDLLLGALDEANWEFSLVFEGLSDEDLWRRPHPKLLSVGELAGHVAYWTAIGITTHLPENSPDRIQSALVDKRFDYYTNEIDQAITLDLGVEFVAAEVKRIHERAKAMIVQANPELTDPNPSRPSFTWAGHLKYQAFHVAYHTGQAYSVRHLLGHTTTDN